jgi:hypothetical protein
MQPIPPITVEDCGEDDLTFFARHGEARFRFRHPRPDDDFPDAILSEARSHARGEVLVLVAIDRDTGTRARAIVCVPGGSA